MKMILTSLILILLIVGLLGSTSIYYSRRTFDEAAERLSAAYNSALETRAETQTLTVAESARTALMQTDYSSLQNFVPQAAKIDRDIVALYVITDNGLIAAHSDSRVKEGQPVAEVDPLLGPEMAKITKPITKEIEAEAKGGKEKERRKVFARPVVASGKKFGTLVVTYSMASLQRQLEEIEAKKNADVQAYGVQIALLGLVFLLVGAGLAVFQGLRIARPIKLLALGASQIAGGQMDARVAVDSKDEIGLLADNFNYMADRLKALLDETAAKAVLEKELELARTIQETLVPPAELIERGPLRVAGHFQPATQCGGDWWAVHDIADGRILVIIGDVTGHGCCQGRLRRRARTRRAAPDRFAHPGADEPRYLRERTTPLRHDLLCLRHRHAGSLDHVRQCRSQLPVLVSPPQHLAAGRQRDHGPYVAWQPPGRCPRLDLCRVDAGAASRRPLGVLHRRTDRVREPNWRRVR
jgi:phosphoserine phosphatase RsbU/P